MRKIILTVILISFSVSNIKAQDIQAITNGFPIEIQNVPYQVSIQNKSDGNHFCGGSIINNKYILTAAHCVSGTNASNITLNVGFSTQNNPGNNLQSYNAKRIVIHPNYNNTTNDFDIAIIEIDGTFSFNNFVQPIELISSQNLIHETIGNQARVSGWGWTVPNQSGVSNQLQAVDVPIISNQQSDNQLDLSSPNHPELTQRMLSTGAVGMERQGACHGDSGGPLVFRQNGQNDIQIGVVSWGVSRCVGGENSPSIYARLSQLVDWINGEVWNFAKIQGSNDVCYNSSKTFTIQNVPNFINVINWQVSSNATILTSNNSSVTVRAKFSNSTGDGWVRATLNNDIQFTETFGVGIPNNQNISIHKAGSFKLYNSAWNWIHARYNGSYDYNVPNWEWRFYASQGVTIMTRSAYKSTINVRPTTDGTVDIQTRVSNECGCSGWRSKVFQIGNGGGSTGSGPGLEW